MRPYTSPSATPDRSTAPTERRGAYFLANDRILDIVIAFLNSFRLHNRDIPLCLIPFDDDVEQVSRLADRYGFSIWSDHALLRACDAIGQQFHGRITGHYRKLAIWHGDFSQFVYIDADTVVFRNVDFVFELLSSAAFITSHSNLPEIRSWVWKDSIVDAQVLTAAQIAFAANTGFLASSHGCLTLDRCRAALPGALALKEHMALETLEQPLLNYLIVTSGLPYTSLLSIARDTRAWTMPLEVWAGDCVRVFADGQVVSPRWPRVLLVHWAGEWKRAQTEGRPIPHEELWSFYRHLPPARLGRP